MKKSRKNETSQIVIKGATNKAIEVSQQNDLSIATEKYQRLPNVSYRSPNQL